MSTGVGDAMRNHTYGEHGKVRASCTTSNNLSWQTPLFLLPYRVCTCMPVFLDSKR